MIFVLNDITDLMEEDGEVYYTENDLAIELYKVSPNGQVFKVSLLVPENEEEYLILKTKIGKAKRVVRIEERPVDLTLSMA